MWPDGSNDVALVHLYPPLHFTLPEPAGEWQSDFWPVREVHNNVESPLSPLEDSGHEVSSTCGQR